MESARRRVRDGSSLRSLSTTVALIAIFRMNSRRSSWTVCGSGVVAFSGLLHYQQQKQCIEPHSVCLDHFCGAFDPNGRRFVVCVRPRMLLAAGGGHGPSQK